MASYGVYLSVDFLIGLCACHDEANGNGTKRKCNQYGCLDQCLPGRNGKSGIGRKHLLFMCTLSKADTIRTELSCLERCLLHKVCSYKGKLKHSRDKDLWTVSCLEVCQRNEVCVRRV